MSSQVPDFSKMRLPLMERHVSVLMGTILLCLAISNVSLWCDEGLSVMLAAQPSIGSWFHALMAVDGSEPQMPGYLLYLWACTKLIGTSEWVLRLANLPWAALFAASLAYGESRGLWPRRVWLVLCLSPFAWFYMNEARPYMMVISIALAILVALLCYSRNPEHFPNIPWFVCAALFLLCSVHMLAVTIIPSLLIFLYIMRPRPSKEILRSWIYPVLVTFPLYLGLAMYYFYTLKLGKTGLLERPGLSNLAFAIYEFLGLSGLGPPRSALRQSPSLHTFLPYLPTLSLGFVAIGFALFAIVLRLREPNERRSICALSIAFLLGTLLTLLLSYITRFRMLGRHVAADFAFFAGMLLVGLASADGKKIGKVSVVALLLMGVAWAVSDYRLRVLPSYQKDDVRGAAAIALDALRQGDSVIWLSDIATASYYHLPTNGVLTSATQLIPGEASSGVCTPAAFEKILHGGRNVLVVISDRDEHDSGGGCKRILALANPRHIESPQDFNIWLVTNR